MASIRGTSAGQFEKVALAFDEPFWEDDLKTHILHLSERVPMEFPLFLDLQRISGLPALVGLCSAGFARATYRLPETSGSSAVTAMLEQVLGRELPKPRASALSRLAPRSVHARLLQLDPGRARARRLRRARARRPRPGPVRGRGNQPGADRLRRRGDVDRNPRGQAPAAAARVQLSAA